MREDNTDLDGALSCKLYKKVEFYQFCLAGKTNILMCINQSILVFCLMFGDMDLNESMWHQ